MAFWSTQPENDIDKARIALIAFHNSSVGVGPYDESLDSLIVKFGGTARMEDFGFAINSIGMSVSQVEDSMEALANKSQGRIPNWNSFFKALSDRVSKPTFMDYVGATPQIAGETALTVVGGFQEIGNSLIDGGKIITMILPFLMVGGVIYIFYSQSKHYGGMKVSKDDIFKSFGF